MFAATIRKHLEQSQLIRHYIWKYRRLFVVGLFSLVLLNALEIFPPILIMKAVDAATHSHHGPFWIGRNFIQELVWLGLIYLSVGIVMAYCRYLWRIYLIRASMLAGRDMRERFVSHLFGLSASFFDKRRIGDLMSLATTDIEAVRMAMGPGLLTLADALFFFMTVPVAMYWLSPKLTAMAFLPFPLILALVLRNERLIHSRFGDVQESFGKLTSMAQETLNGVRVLKAFAKEDSQIDQFKIAGQKHMRLALRLSRVQTSFGPTLDFTMSLGLVLLLWLGGGGVIDGTLTLGVFVAFQRYIQKMIWPMAAIGMALAFYQRAIASTERLFEILNITSDTPDPIPSKNDPKNLRGEIEFRNLDFAFPGTSRKVLSGISLKIQPGERVAFLGGVGSGKSALLSLMPRLYPVARGMLFIDGVDVNDWNLKDLRQMVGYVGQDVFLFSESVQENIKYGYQASSSEHARVEDATRMASVHDEVLGLTEGYQTRLGERGVNLSGGQKQRLTIARAIAKSPTVLILDDALSAVDVQTEEKILTALRGRSGRHTEIVAAHRISTIKDADRIVVLENGEIRQMGTYAQLLEDRRGLFRNIYESQMLKEDLDQYAEGLST